MLDMILLGDMIIGWDGVFQADAVYRSPFGPNSTTRYKRGLRYTDERCVRH